MSGTAQHKNTKILGMVTMLLRLALVVVAVLSAITGNWSALFASLATLGFTYVPLLLANQMNVRLPLQFELAITLFLYGTIFLGEVGDYYERFWWWDTVMHVGSAFAFGFAGFLVLYLLVSRNKIAASPSVIAVFSFAFGLSIGTLWEIFEYAADNLLGLNMQKSGLRDTMGDLIVDAIGAGAASTIGYVYLKDKIRDPFEALINWFLLENPRFQRRNKKASKN